MEVRNATIERIMDVARKEFLEKGYQGARMQAIADSAGINKASLHYYFDSKDKLFEAIFEEAMQKVLPIMLKALIEEPSLEEVQDHVCVELPRYCAPRRLIVVSSLPRTSLGKVRRRDLVEELTSRE
ncbi:MAG: TetR family transcriptional regulator [Ilumatobacteraceae bacterium]|nr:TetR family transcriptional regulator [Ilumatobacteraceae bacterium]